MRGSKIEHQMINRKLILLLKLGKAFITTNDKEYKVSYSTRSRRARGWLVNSPPWYHVVSIMRHVTLAAHKIPRPRSFARDDLI